MPSRDFDAFPEQAAAIPFRVVGRQLQLCVIRRKTSTSWGIPKGLVDPGTTHEETALNEAWEEAGLEGRVLGPAIGTYRYRKWGNRLTVAVYAMELVQQAPAWEEAGLEGRVLGAAIGTYRYRKWGNRLTVAVYAMELVQQARTWDESSFRERLWVPFTEAGILLADHPVAPLLARAHSLVTTGRYRLA